MNSKQRFFLYFFTAILFSFSFSILYLYFPKQLQSVDELLRTTMFELRGEIKDSGNIVIVDIDNRSLAQIGQWPWSRNIVAKLLNTLTQAQAGIIGIDMIFAEADRTSPSLVLKNMNIPIKNIANYDTILAQTLAQTPTILSYQFAFGKDIYSKKETPLFQGTVIKHASNEHVDDFIDTADGVLLNIPVLQENSYSSGFVNYATSKS